LHGKQKRESATIARTEPFGKPAGNDSLSDAGTPAAFSLKRAFFSP